jgi:integrase/recombinase XerD
VPHLRILGKGSKVRYVPAHPLALERIHDYLGAAGHGEDPDGPLFRPLKNPAGRGDTDRPLTHGVVYHHVLRVSIHLEERLGRVEIVSIK